MSEDVGKLISMMVKHLVSVLCKWLVVRGNAAVYLCDGELRMKGLASRASVNRVGARL